MTNILLHRRFVISWGILKDISIFLSLLHRSYNDILDLKGAETHLPFWWRNGQLSTWSMRWQHVDESRSAGTSSMYTQALSHAIFVIASFRIFLFRNSFAYDCSEIFGCSKLASYRKKSMLLHDTLSYKLVILCQVWNEWNSAQIKLLLQIHFQNNSNLVIEDEKW